MVNQSLLKIMFFSPCTKFSWNTWLWNIQAIMNWPRPPDWQGVPHMSSWQKQKHIRRKYRDGQGENSRFVAKKIVCTQNINKGNIEKSWTVSPGLGFLVLARFKCGYFMNFIRCLNCLGQHALAIFGPLLRSPKTPNNIPLFVFILDWRFFCAPDLSHCPRGVKNLVWNVTSTYGSCSPLENSNNY